MTIGIHRAFLICLPPELLALRDVSAVQEANITPAGDGAEGGKRIS
jgi:hypothetical protein